MGPCMVSVDYRVINEKATVKPQFSPTSLEDEYTIMQPTYANTLPGTTSMVTPLAKSTPITQVHHECLQYQLFHPMWGAY